MVIVINIVLDKQDFFKISDAKKQVGQLIPIAFIFPLISTNDLIKDEKKQIRGRDARKVLKP